MWYITIYSVTVSQRRALRRIREKDERRTATTVIITYENKQYNFQTLGTRVSLWTFSPLPPKSQTHIATAVKIHFIFSNAQTFRYILHTYLHGDHKFWFFLLTLLIHIYVCFLFCFLITGFPPSHVRIIRSRLGRIIASFTRGGVYDVWW